MIPDWVKRYVGLPFAAHGRSAAGYDCWGLVLAIMSEQFGIELPDFAYGDPQDHRSVAEIVLAANHGDWKRVEDAREGDLIVIQRGSRPCHFGVVYTPGWFIHCQRGMGVVRESYTSSRYSKRIWAIGRHRSRWATQT